MEMDGEVGSAGDDMALVAALVGGPVGGEDGGPVGCCGLCSFNVVVGLVGMGNDDVGCSVVDPGGRCNVIVDVSVVCSRLRNKGYNVGVVVEEVEALTEVCVEAVMCVGNSGRSCEYCGRSLQFPSVDSVEV